MHLAAARPSRPASRPWPAEPISLRAFARGNDKAPSPGIVEIRKVVKNVTPRRRYFLALCDLQTKTPFCTFAPTFYNQLTDCLASAIDLKMKTILPWLVAVLALVAAGVLYQSTKSKSVELATLQAEVKELETLRTALAELKSQQVPAEEVARLRKDNQDLLRLRNEIRQARDEKNQLAKQTQSALSEAQRAQAQARRPRPRYSP